MPDGVNGNKWPNKLIEIRAEFMMKSKFDTSKIKKVIPIKFVR